MLKFLLDLVQEVPARGAICDMTAARETTISSRVQLANDVSLTVLHMPDERARISFPTKRLNSVIARVIDAKLHRLDADFVPSE